MSSCTQGQDASDQGVCLTLGQRIGLVIVAEAGLISLAAVIVALVVITVSYDHWCQ